jgi:uncharacterized membrane protein YgcG
LHLSRKRPAEGAEALIMLNPLELPRLEISTASNSLWMPCPRCEVFVESFGCGSTLVGYGTDEPGHNHDDNCRTFFFHCACSFEWKYRPRNVCPAPDCNWKGKEHCSTCGPVFYTEGGVDWYYKKRLQRRSSSSSGGGGGGGVGGGGTGGGASSGGGANGGGGATGTDPQLPS